MLRFQSTFPRGERRFLRGGSRLVSYFNPRSLVGNDVLRRAACPLLFYFNPRSLVGNDGNQNIRRNQNGNFNPRSLVGNDPIGESRSALISNFNPRSLVGNDPLRAPVHPGYQNFNPRSLVGNDHADVRCPVCTPISIHVPSWGTTFRSGSVRPYLSISIHVPSWGTTANFHKYSLFFYAINIIFLLFIIPSLFSLVLFMLLF